MGSFGGKVKRLRTEVGMTAEQLAEACGISSVAVYGLEKDASSPMFSTARKLAKALNVPLDEFADVRLPKDRRSR